MKCIVICREDSESGTKGPYTLASRTVFENEEAAKLYAVGISPSREAIVVPGDYLRLRFDEERGTLAYWQDTAPGADLNRQGAAFARRRRQEPVGVPDEDGALGDVDGDDS